MLHVFWDEIPHSGDIKANVVSRTASEVLKNKTGICWTKFERVVCESIIKFI